MDVLACSVGEYHVKLHICNKADIFLWSGPDELKAGFLRELLNLAKHNPHPILIGGF
jgi:hypothetical protein